MQNLIIKVTILFSLLLPSIANAQGNGQKFEIWLDNFKQEALAAGISPTTIENSLADIKITKKVVKLDKKQPFKVKTFNQYKSTTIPISRVKKANKKYKANKKLLDKIGKEYGVQPRFIVALWGIESDFGRNQGKFSVINSLATLAFEGRREKFFKSELISALKIIDNGHVSKENLQGSWAGAMGQTQFMPSSFLALAVDYNKDGKKDIWSTKADVFASIANYLANRGWDNETTWGRQVKLPKKFSENLIDPKIEKSLGEWQELGVRRANGNNLPNRHELKASLIRPEDDKNETYLVYSNYKTILKWNRSLYFATAVGILSDKLL